MRDRRIISTDHLRPLCFDGEVARYAARAVRRLAAAGSAALALFLLAGPTAADETPAPSGKRTSNSIFEKADTDKDGRLTLEEYVAIDRTQPEILRRDFGLFDLDASGGLSLDEFRTIPGRVPEAERLAIPDPVDAILDQAVAALDETWGGWDKQPNRLVQSGLFVVRLFQSLDPEGGMPATQTEIQLADPDRDGQTTREEARRFLEIHLGMRAPTGELLRRPPNRVVNFAVFLGVDADKDNRLSRDEFLGTSYLKDKGAEFAKADGNQDGFLSIDEFASLSGTGVIDPVRRFLQIDTNFDGFLDAAEFETGAYTWQTMLTKPTRPAFDADGDGRLSLQEYLFTMQANPVLGWHSEIRDTDRDQALSFKEFTFGRGQFALLRRTYFFHLDRNGDNRLDRDEFPFKVRESHTLFTLGADGTGWARLYQEADTPACGSPAVSPDGKWVAFDGYGKDGLSTSHVYVVSINGTGRRDLGEGLMPTWSADSKRLACSRYGEANGVWIISADGTPVKKVSRGWGAQWSPDGRKIAYTINEAIMVYDVEKDESSTIVEAGDNPYSSVYWNMGWSPDSTRLMFKGVKSNGESGIASVSAAGDKPDLKVHLTTKNTFENDIAWSPDGTRVVFGMKAPEDQYVALYEFNPHSNEPPTRVKGQDLTVGPLCDVCWTPDGKAMVITCRGK